jgi:ABC-type sugar transport system permease subunit
VTKGSGARAPGRVRRALRSDAAFGYLLLSPSAALVAIVLIVPIAVAVSMAFLRIDLTRSPDWTFFGAGNFLQLRTDTLAAAAIPRTLYFAALTVVGCLVLSLGVALLLNERFRGRGAVRVIVLIPWALSPLAAGTTWFLLFYQGSGGVNAVLYGLGLIPDYVSWLDDAGRALHIAIIGQIWLTVPLASLLIFARLQSIPENLYRAAVMDGARTWSRFRHVTLPMVRNTVIILALIETIIALQTFDLVFALTRGGPALGTVLFNLLVYQRGFVDLRLGYAASLALILFALIALSSLLVYLLVGRERRKAGA